jgi:Mg2+/Co2+ transporter CorB
MLDTVKGQVDDIVKEVKDVIEELVGEVRTAMKDTEEQLKK